MALVRWEPVRELDTLQSDFNRIFDAFLGRPASANGLRRWVPAIDLVEAGDQLVMRADLPGLDEGDVSIEVKDRVLTISGERPVEHEDRGESFYRVERPAGSFSRSLTLPEGVEGEAVRARFEKGVLEVTIPKPKEKVAHRVKIEGATVEGSAERR